MINIILCGGSGTRLWPLSRQMYPKQFVNLINNRSLFQETIKRNSQLFNRFCIVTNKEHYFIAEHQMEDISSKKETKFILEPVGRNTAPAIALACFNYDPEEIVFVTPSDHIINNEKEYTAKIKAAIELASEGKLVTFGIKPEYPETGYGYIEALIADKNSTSHKVSRFKEKPDKATAEKYIKQENFFWNSGMFAFKAGVFLDELRQYSPEIYDRSKAAHEASEIEKTNMSFKIIISDELMNNIPSDSIDYAVMEKSDKAYVVTGDIGWNDLGSYDSLYDIAEKDSDGNSINSNLIAVNSKNNLVFSDKRKLSLVGVNDLIVVDTDDALLISQKGCSQDVKAVVTALQKGTPREKELAVVHSTVHRPWGTYTVLDDNEKFKIKRIEVKPGKRLSLQKHLHRSEHWVVVTGTAIVQIGDDEKVLRKNESTYIAIGEVHRLANIGKIDLVIIETQVGEYLGEDDIIRLEDDYRRGN